MQDTPKLRLVVDNEAALDAELDRRAALFARLKAVAPDPDGEHIWLLFEPEADAVA